MYVGKYEAPRNRGKHRKSLALTVSLLLLIVAVVGGTLAYMATMTGPVVNKFSYGDVPIDIPEKFDGTTKSDVQIHNIGKADAFVRAKIVVTWKDANGNVSSTAVKDSDYTMTTGDGWYKDADGFWYCTNRVKAGENSAVLITEAKKTTTAAAPEGHDLSIDILAQSIQADGEKNGMPMVENFWPVDAEPNGQHAQTIVAK